MPNRADKGNGFAFVQEDDYWRIDVTDLRYATETLGERTFTRFCRSMIFLDRISSLWNLVELSRKEFGENNPAHQRNTITSLVLICGVLREAAKAVIVLSEEDFGHRVSAASRTHQGRIA